MLILGRELRSLLRVHLRDDFLQLEGYVCSAGAVLGRLYPICPRSSICFGASYSANSATLPELAHLVRHRIHSFRDSGVHWLFLQ